MARPLRIEYPGAWYHVMNRGVEKRDVFARPGDGLQFLTLLAEAASLAEAECHAYCLMRNHYHLLLHTPRGNLSGMMKHLGARYTQRFNLSRERDGPLFRGRYKAILIDADNYLLQVSRYIHRNPVAAGLVEQADQYRWSSYRDYLVPDPAPEWLRRDMLLKMAGGPDAYRDYVETGTDRETESFFARGRHPAVFGGKAFRERLGGKPRERTPARPTLDTILGAVAKTYDVEPEALTRDYRGRDGEPRAMAMLLCHRLGGLRLTDIAEALGGSVPAVSQAIKRIQQHMAEDAKLARRAARLEDALAKS